MGLGGEKTRQISTTETSHLPTWRSATWETRALAQGSGLGQASPWLEGEGISVRLSPRAAGLCPPPRNLWHLDHIRLSDHSCHPSPCARRAPPSVRSPVQTDQSGLGGTLTMGVLYLWLTTSLISGTKTGRARNKTESSKLRVVLCSPRRWRPAQGPSLRAAPRAAARATAVSVQPLQEESACPQTLPCGLHGSLLVTVTLPTSPGAPAWQRVNLSPAWSLLLPRAPEKRRRGKYLQLSGRRELHPCHQPKTRVLLRPVPCPPTPDTERPEAG